MNSQNLRFGHSLPQTSKLFPLPLPDHAGRPERQQTQSQPQPQPQYAQQSQSIAAEEHPHQSAPASTHFKPLQTKSVYSGPIPPPSLFRHNADDAHLLPTLPPISSVEGIDTVPGTRKRKSSDQSARSAQSASDEDRRQSHPEPQRSRKGKSARRRACEECARAKARCKVEPGNGHTPPMCTRCKMYGHACMLPEGYVIDNEWVDDETPKKRGRRNTITNVDDREREKERDMQRRMSEAWHYHTSPPASYQFIPTGFMAQTQTQQQTQPQQQQSQQQQQQQQQQRYGYPNIYYPPSPAPSMDVAFLQAEMASYPFLRNIAGYDLSRLSLFLSAAIRVGITQISYQSEQPGQSQGPQPPPQPQTDNR